MRHVCPLQVCLILVQAPNSTEASSAVANRDDDQRTRIPGFAPGQGLSR